MRFLVLSALFFLSIGSSFASDPARPDVIVILTDDQGWGVSPKVTILR